MLNRCLSMSYPCPIPVPSMSYPCLIRAPYEINVESMSYRCGIGVMSHTSAWNSRRVGGALILPHRRCINSSSTSHRNGNVGFGVGRTSWFAAHRFANRKKNRILFNSPTSSKSWNNRTGSMDQEGLQCLASSILKKCSCSIGFCRALASVKGKHSWRFKL